ncbi:MAG: hypothetical protein N4J56_006925 [Chroococcidiopsis sp. SAG 2025]|nr:hypothetical protein [Chroococcidiopsis sp. SAG 2025]
MLGALNLCSRFQPNNVLLILKSLAQELTIVLSGQLMLFWVEVVSNRFKSGEKALGLPWRFESPHPALSNSCRSRENSRKDCLVPCVVDVPHSSKLASSPLRSSSACQSRLPVARSLVFSEACAHNRFAAFVSRCPCSKISSTFLSVSAARHR